MDYPTLLLHLENQMQFLQNKRHDYMNIEAMPKVELKQLLEGLGGMMSSQSRLPEVRQGIQNPILPQSSIVEATDKKPPPPTLFPPFPDAPVSQKKTTIAGQAEKAMIPAENIFQQKPAEMFSTLSELMLYYKSCQHCSLGQTRTNFVFGCGLSHSPVMFIGEGPGADEDARGEPFVGRAGKLLTKMISTIGIERPDTYISNIVKCRPPGNRNPTPAEISCCLPIIQRQIELLNPKLIVTLGNVPTRTLLDDIPGITKVRGKLLQYRQWTVLPTFHPSYLLRNRSAMPLAWEDFKKIPDLAFRS